MKPLYTPMRALLRCRWQVPDGVRDHPVAELGPGEYTAVNNDDILMTPSILGLQPERLGHQAGFPHRLIKHDTVITHSGYIACHVMYPFGPGSVGVNAIVAVWEENEDFRVVRTDLSRILVARALVDYISPIEQDREFIELRAGIPEAPRSDTFM